MVSVAEKVWRKPKTFFFSGYSYKQWKLLSNFPFMFKDIQVYIPYRNIRSKAPFTNHILHILAIFRNSYGNDRIPFILSYLSHNIQYFYQKKKKHQQQQHSLKICIQIYMKADSISDEKNILFFNQFLLWVESLCVCRKSFLLQFSPRNQTY